MIGKDILGLVSIACAAMGYGIYILSILRRRTRPHAFSWSVWGLLMAIVFVAQMTKGAGSGAWVTGFSALACLIIAALSVTRGEKDIVRSDWYAFGGALVTIPVWYLTRDPLWAIIFATLIDGLAYYPTFRKSWHKPHEENFQTYCFDMIKWVVALAAMQNYAAATLIYPLFLLCANACLVALILLRRHAMSRRR